MYQTFFYFFFILEVLLVVTNAWYIDKLITIFNNLMNKLLYPWFYVCTAII